MAGGVAVAASAAPSSAWAQCATAGTDPVTFTCATNTNTTNTTNTTSPNAATSDHVQQFGADLVGQVNTGVTVGGFGLNLTTTKSNGGVTFINSGAVGVSVDLPGLIALELNGNGGTVSYSGAGTVSAGTFQNGLLATNTTGNIVLTPTGTITANVFAIKATTGDGGNVTVTTSQNVTANGNSTAIVTSATTGTTMVNITGGTVSSNFGNGINATATTGKILVTNNGAVSSAFNSGTGLALFGGVGNTIINNGSISGASGITATTGNMSVYNAGSISASNLVAIQFAGTGNSLTIAPTATFTGNAIGTGSDLFQLGGPGTGTFDIASLLPTHQFRGFGSFAKVDDSTWTLTGTNFTSMPWTVKQGTLNVATNMSVSPFTVQGGLLSVTSTGIVGSATVNGGTMSVLSGGLVGPVTVNGGALNDAGSVGATTLNNGTISVLSGGSAGPVTMNGGTLTDAGTTGAATVNNGTMSVLSGGLAGPVTVNGGALTDAGTTGAATINNGTMSVLSGGLAGPVTVNGGALNDAGTTGAATVNGGTMSVLSGGLAGPVVVNGGLLTGEGTVGSTQVNAGGTFAPGLIATPGTSMTVAGNLAFASGALYLVYLNPATSSFTNVSGTATLNGLVGANFASGTYVAKQYTILTAAGGVSGTFAGVDSLGLPSGFNTSLSYDATHAFLDLTLNFIPPSGALNINQQNVANAIINFFNANGGIPLVFGGLTPAGLTQLSGEGATGAQQATFDAMSQFINLLTDPFISGRGDPVSAGGSPTAYAEETLAYAAKKKQTDAFAMFTKAPPVTPFAQRWSVWAAGFGGSQRTDGNAVLGSNDTRSSIFGTAVGADYRISPNTLAGFALAGGGTNFSVNTLGSGRSDLFQAGAFVRHNAGPAYVTGALAYGWQDVTTDRIVTMAGLDHLRAEFNANAWSGRVEGGYRFATGGFGITPYVAGQFVTFDLPSYMEQAIVGSNQFALGYNAKSATDARSELGVRTDKSFAMANGILTLRGRLAWAHDYDPDRSALATFQTLPGASFVVSGARHTADSALTTASAEWKWINGWSAAATFEGEFSDITNSYAGKGVVRYAW